jgi:peptidoglycan/xylan/chitin deacetylase (PgdA/CDA1 family)
MPANDHRSLLGPLTKNEGPSSPASGWLRHLDLKDEGPGLPASGWLRHPLGSAVAGAAVLGCAAAYALPALAGARARGVSDGACGPGRGVLDVAGACSAGLVRGVSGSAGAALCRRLGIEDRTASGAGYALTFDDGPHRQGTPAVLEVLAREGVRATFFLVGEQVLRNPALAAEIAAAGHGVGLHCHRHRNLLRLTPRQVREDILRALGVIEEATGRSPELYRPPYGVSNATALALARRRGWRTLLWSHWGRDWEARATPESIAALLTGGAAPGAVLLLHDADDYSAPSSWRRTVAALPWVLETLAARELEPVAP